MKAQPNPSFFTLHTVYVRVREGSSPSSFGKRSNQLNSDLNGKIGVPQYISPITEAPTRLPSNNLAYTTQVPGYYSVAVRYSSPITCSMFVDGTEVWRGLLETDASHFGYTPLIYLPANKTITIGDGVTAQTMYELYVKGYPVN